GVFAFGNGTGQGLFDRLGDVEMRLADAEVDRVGHLRRQVEDLTDTRGVNSPHPLGDPAFAHAAAFVNVLCLRRAFVCNRAVSERPALRPDRTMNQQTACESGVSLLLRTWSRCAMVSTA